MTTETVGVAGLRVCGSRDRAAERASARSSAVETSIRESICAPQLALHAVDRPPLGNMLFVGRAPADAARPQPLADDRPQDTETVAPGPQVALTVNPGGLVARHLDHLQAGGKDADVHQGLNLEPVRVAFDGRDDPLAPEGVVAVAKIGVAAAEPDAHERPESPVAGAPQRPHVGGAAALEEA